MEKQGSFALVLVDKLIIEYPSALRKYFFYFQKYANTLTKLLEMRKTYQLVWLQSVHY